MAAAKIFGADLFLDPVSPSVESALAPARKVEGRFAQGLRGDRAGVNRYAANPFALFYDQNLLAEFGCLDGCTATGWSAADDDEVVLVHGMLRLGIILTVAAVRQGSNPFVDAYSKVLIAPVQLSICLIAPKICALRKLLKICLDDR